MPRLSVLNKRGVATLLLAVVLPYLLGRGRAVLWLFAFGACATLFGPYYFRMDLPLSAGESAWAAARPVKTILEIQGKWGNGTILGYDHPLGIPFMNALLMNSWRGKDFEGDRAAALVFRAFFFIPTGMEYNHVGGSATLVKTAMDHGEETVAMRYDLLPIVDYLKWQDERTLIGKMLLFEGKVTCYYSIQRLT